MFRTLDDTRALLERRGPACKAVVIGGGLLGLEAARGLQVQGCDVTVVHLCDTLMERQLDPDGGEYLKRKMEDLGVKRAARTNARRRILGNGQSKASHSSDGERIDADLVVIAAGIRPNADLGRKAGVDGQPRHRRQRLHGDVRPRHLRGRRMHRASRRIFTAWSRRCSNRARFSPRPSPAIAGRLYAAPCRRRSSRSWASMSSPRATWSEQNRRRSRSATKTARSASTRSCCARQQARRRHSRRRRLRQPSLHGLAAQRAPI